MYRDDHFAKTLKSLKMLSRRFLFGKVMEVGVPLSPLGFKMIFGVVVALLLVTGLFLALLYQYHKEQLITSLRQQTSRIGQIIEISLEDRMLDKDTEGFQQIINTLGQEKGVEGIQIIDKRGRVWVASHPDLVGRNLALESPSCRICHDKGLREGSQTVLVSPKGDAPLFRLATPIPNREACKRCHDRSRELNGVLLMDFSMETLSRQLAASRTKMILWTAISAFVMIGVVWFLLDRTVLRKIKAIVTFSRQVERGELDRVIQLKGNDEVAPSGRSSQSNDDVSQAVDFGARETDRVPGSRDQRYWRGPGRGGSGPQGRRRQSGLSLVGHGEQRGHHRIPLPLYSPWKPEAWHNPSPIVPGN